MAGGRGSAKLAEERIAWRKNHPPGFKANPETNYYGFLNLMRWKCTVPGKKGTDWEGGHYPVTLEFSEDYPYKPPLCSFPKHFFHPNVFKSTGEICLSILGNDWRPCINVRHILVGIQDLLHQPNTADSAQHECSRLLITDPAEYKARVREQARKYPVSG